MSCNWDELYELQRRENEIMLTNFDHTLQYATSVVISEMVHDDDEGSSSRGSVMGRKNKRRDRVAAHKQLMNDYFVRNPVYSTDDFRRRFRMRQSVFMRLLHKLQLHNSFFQQRSNCAGEAGFTGHQRVSAAIRMLAYASPADSLDEYFRIGESTAIENLREFCRTVVEMHKDEYLRAPTAADMNKLLIKATRRGFPGMIGSLDCMHWQWKNCPTAWHGAFTGRSHKPTIILEAVASHDTWIWHAFFGMPGSRNDINTLGCSPLFDRLTRGEVPRVQYQVNGNEYHMPYYLVDGIYPKWGSFVQSIRNPHSPEEQHFSKMQESYRKDVERAFGILQARFAIVKQPGRGWDRGDLANIMMTCVILHNIIVEDERDEYNDDDSDDDETDGNRSRRARAYFYDQAFVDPNPRTGNIDLETYMMRYRSIRSQPLNAHLKQDLIQHLWSRHGQGN